MTSMSTEQKKEWSELFQNPNHEEFPTIAEGLKKKAADCDEETETPSNNGTSTSSSTPEPAPKIELISGAKGQPTVTPLASFKSFPIGARVVISGLLSEAGRQINGKIGIIKAMDLEKIGRWAVEVEGVKKSLKSDNLTLESEVLNGAPSKTAGAAGAGGATNGVSKEQMDQMLKAMAAQHDKKQKEEAKLKNAAPVEEGKTFKDAAMNALDEEEKALLEKDESEDELDGTIKKRENMNTFFDIDSAIKAGAVPEDVPGVAGLTAIQKALLEKDQVADKSDDEVDAKKEAEKPAESEKKEE